MENNHPMSKKLRAMAAQAEDYAKWVNALADQCDMMSTAHEQQKEIDDKEVDRIRGQIRTLMNTTLTIKW